MLKKRRTTSGIVDLKLLMPSKETTSCEEYTKEAKPTRSEVIPPEKNAHSSQMLAFLCVFFLLPVSKMFVNLNVAAGSTVMASSDEHSISSPTYLFPAEERDLQVTLSVSNENGLSIRTSFRYPKTPLRKRLSRDFGGLKNVRREPLQKVRKLERLIQLNDAGRYERERKRLLRLMEAYVDNKFLPDDDLIETRLTEPCTPTSFEKLLFSNCNAFHEYSMDRSIEDILQGVSTKYLGHGSYRDVYKGMDLLQRDDAATRDPTMPKGFIWKNMLFDPDLDFDHRRFYQINADALIMERLTASPRIADIYGKCGTSVMQELLLDTVVNRMEGPYGGHATRKQFMRVQRHEPDAMNNLTLSEKLSMAIEFAESLAELHGFEGGTMMHGDFHSPQWLHSSDGHLKLNDFNKAHIFRYNQMMGQYCTTERCYHGSYRSPEDNRCAANGHEASDTFSLGNNIYMLLTGLWPHEEYRNSPPKLHRLIGVGAKLPYLDPVSYSRSKIEAGLVNIMEKCWEWDQDKRISVFEVLRRLYAMRNASIPPQEIEH